jgi:aryl-alcohol dehydrogenase-like predicted oxidoreductase
MKNSASPSGTRYFAKHAVESKGIDSKHFREFAELELSSLGMGTYLGGLDAKTDRLVECAIVQSIESGAINVIDTAINYRYQRAERSVGRALASLISKGSISREQVFISTKNGYLAPDAEHPGGPERYIQEELFDGGIISPGDIVDSSHCMTEKFLSHELDRSLANLKLDCIDLLYLHNSAESQIRAVGKDEYMRRLRSAFSFFETALKEGKIKFYGMATWDCFRIPDSEEGHLDLEEILEIAHDASGGQNGFKFVQFPFNAAMPEALTSKTQKVAGEKVSLLESCSGLGIGAFTSVPLMQGRLLGRMKVNIGSLTSAQVNLQFARSASGIIAPLAGQKNPSHVSENLALAKVPPLTQDDFRKYFLN